MPPEGDWQEGVTYWFVTLFMGLRFAAALRRLTGGKVDLFEHPALSITGDFAMMTTTPGGRVYNFNDNQDRLMPGAAEGLLLLATLTGRRDWLAVARRFPTESPLWLATDDPDIPSETPTHATAAKFPYTGVATMRSGWDPEATWVGFKCSPSEVSHGHLDANSFVLESGGVPLVIDEGTWPYGAHMGYGDTKMLRWNWDALSTVGHNTLLVDGQGQAQGKDYVGRVASLEHGRGWDMVVGDASKMYPGLLKSFVRTLLFIHPDVLVVRDVVECEGERHAEWLLHYAGSIRAHDAQDGEGIPSIVENEGVRLVVTPLLPDRSLGWRVSDVTRASVYESHDTLQDVQRAVRYRSFSPFRAAGGFEFLFGLRVNGDESGRDWEFTPGPDGWTLKPDGTDQVILPTDNGLRLEGASGASS